MGLFLECEVREGLTLTQQFVWDPRIRPHELPCRDRVVGDFCAAGAPTHHSAKAK